MIDVNEIFSKYYEEKERWVSARRASQVISDPFSLWAEYNAPVEEKEELNEYQKLLFSRGNEHEERVVKELFTDALVTEYATPAEGFKKVLEWMQQGVTQISNAPIFHKDLEANGVVDVLEKRTGKNSVFGDYYYVVKEIKQVRNIKPKHRLQAAFYNLVIGLIQGYTPQEFYLINQDSQTSTYEYDIVLEESIKENIKLAKELMTGKLLPSPTYEGSSWPWSSYANKLAKKNKDISLITSVGASMKKKLNEAGYYTLQDMANTTVQELKKVKGIGELKAKNFVLSAQSLAENKIILTNPENIVFEKKLYELYVDFEGVEEVTDTGFTINMDYLIGVLQKNMNTNEEKFIPFLAHKLSHENRMLKEFLKHLQNLEGDFVIYHYHHYERTHFVKMFKQYNTPNHLQELVLNNLVDLYKIATTSAVYPTTGNGLKALAKSFGFSWRQNDVNAMESIALYLDYVKNGVKESLQKAVDYNEDDCVATRVIRDKLEELKNEKKE